MKPAFARSVAHSTYCRANPCVPCRTRATGHGPAPDGRATAARIVPRSGMATVNHFTGNVSVPAGAALAATVGGLCKPPRRVCADPSQTAENSVPTVTNTAARYNFNI